MHIADFSFKDEFVNHSLLNKLRKQHCALDRRPRKRRNLLSNDVMKDGKRTNFIYDSSSDTVFQKK